MVACRPRRMSARWLSGCDRSSRVRHPVAHRAATIAPACVAAYTSTHAAFVPSPPVLAPACLSGGGADAGRSADQPLEPGAADRADVHGGSGTVCSARAACRSSNPAARYGGRRALRRRIEDAARRHPPRSDARRSLRLLRLGRTAAAIADRDVAVPVAAAADAGSGTPPGKRTLGLSMGRTRRTWATACRIRWPRCGRPCSMPRARLRFSASLPGIAGDPLLNFSSDADARRGGGSARLCGRAVTAKGWSCVCGC